MKHKTKVIFSTAGSLLIALLSFAIWHESTAYSISEVIQLNNAKLSVRQLDPAIQKAKTLCLEVVTEYRAALAELPPTFKKDVPLWEAKGISAKVVFSTFADSLIYLFPADKSVMYVDLIDVPVQAALTHGLIDLDIPMRQIDKQQLMILLPQNQAEQEYSEMSGGFANKDSGLRLLGPADSTIRFSNTIKLVRFMNKSIFGFYKPRIAVENSAPWYTEMLGKPVSIKLQLKGPLLITGEKDFSWITEEGKKLGRSMAQYDISQLSLASEFFRQSLAHPKLKPVADAIQKKRAHADKDPSFDYPLWQQDLDLKDLKALAKPFNIDDTYVDRLVERRASLSTGFLLWYFQDEWEFMWQWIVINCFFLLLLGASFKARQKLRVEIKHAIGLYGPALIVGINILWIWKAKPDPVTLQYWLLPLVIAILNIALCLLIDWKSTRRRIMDDQVITKSPISL